MKDGRRKTVRQREIATHPDDQGRVAFSYSLNSKTINTRVHRMVAETFIGACPDGMMVCHRDGDPSNNRVENLYYGTQSENMLDRLRHGNDPNATKTHCPQGHPYTESNLRIIPTTGGRVCRSCQAAWARVQRGAPRDQFEQIADNYYRQFTASVGHSMA